MYSVQSVGVIERVWNSELGTRDSKSLEYLVEEALESCKAFCRTGCEPIPPWNLTREGPFANGMVIRVEKGMGADPRPRAPDNEVVMKTNSEMHVVKKRISPVAPVWVAILLRTPRPQLSARAGPAVNPRMGRRPGSRHTKEISISIYIYPQPYPKQMADTNG